MKSVELTRQVANLKQLIRRVGHDPSTKALEMQAHWARYICVLTSGFVENIVRDLYGQYVTKGSYSPAVIRYAKKQLDGVQNPRSSRLIEIAAAFDPAWGRELNAFLALDYRDEALNSIMSNRHLIAHGRSSHITVASVSAYLSKIVEVAEYIEGQCGT